MRETYGLDDYLNSPPAKNCDALKFWKVNCAKYPVLDEIAGDILELNFLRPKPSESSLLLVL